MFFGTFKLNWFALDGEDLLSRFRELGGKQPIVSEEHKKRMEEATPRKKFKRKYKYGKRETQVQKLVEHLEQKRYKLAKVKLAQIREEHGRFQLSEAQLIRLINLATSEKDWPGAVDFMNQYVKRFSSHADLIRVKQAIENEPFIFVLAIRHRRFRRRFLCLFGALNGGLRRLDRGAGAATG